MILKNKICNICSYVFIITGIILNLVNIVFQEDTYFLLGYSGWISGLLFFLGALSIYKSRNLKNKIIDNSVKKFLDKYGEENYNIVKKDTQTDIYLVEINNVLYNINATFTTEGVAIIKQLAELETEIYIEDVNNNSKIFTRNFNYMQDSINIIEEIKKEED